MNIDINISDYNYNLPPERIAQFPLQQRDKSKLLIYKENKITQDYFNHLKTYLPDKSMLVFNNSKVIHARLRFKKEIGSVIEIFCLEPCQIEQQQAFQQKESCKWKCLVGNNKRWKSGKIKQEVNRTTLFAEKIQQEEDHFIIQFSWEPENLSFADILEVFGFIPLPPYINRNADEIDKIRYQTVYAKQNGSVAAPTAGLHFTNELLNEITKAGICTSQITLHVGAGTFKPVSTENVGNHQMHEENFIIIKETLKAILYQIKNNNPIIPVGTTSMRTLESIYWIGVKILLKHSSPFIIDQWEAYQMNNNNILVQDALNAILDYMEVSSKNTIHASTSIIILPGYSFKICNGIITNFHQPKSTLLLLIAALIGDEWKNIYNYAMQHEFRFLSYGDSCLFIP